MKNRVELLGVNIGNEPTINNSHTMATINVAESISYLDSSSQQWQKKTNWYTISLFGKHVKLAESYLHKGMKVNLICHMQPNEYTNKDGAKVKNINIIMDECEFFDSKKKNEEREEHKNDGFLEIPDGGSMGLPFS